MKLNILYLYIELLYMSNIISKKIINYLVFICNSLPLNDTIQRMAQSHEQSNVSRA